MSSGLFRANKLVCNATVTNVFRCRPPNEELSYSNRLSLALVIPEINCYIVASQMGIVSVFRLTTFRGLYGMRQEYVLPNYNRLCLSADSGIRTLVGLNYKKIGEGRFLLFLVYIDGLCLTYELSDNSLSLDLY
ncbi:unnamed protein product [Ambrosiozyma monospora]|uniref:Unnamed protein product n=1 Tax=Ambrosiozyma monospora TaxID=43982 RepID=A0ACB5TQ29_AMBMO|nr:unnamed protein product [Ambrosiozyma monospora]